MASSFRASCRAGRSVLSQHLRRHGHSQHQEQQHLTAQSSSFFARFMSTGYKLFIGGLSWQTDESQLKDAFSSFGDVTEARIVTDLETGASKGFGFVSFASASHADAAMKTMDGRDLNGRKLRVNFANDRQRGFGGFGSGGVYGGGGGGAAYGDGGGGGGGYSGGGGYGGGYNGGGGYGGGYGGGGGGGYGGGNGNGGRGYSSSSNYSSSSYAPPNDNYASRNSSFGSIGSYGGDSASRNSYVKSNESYRSRNPCGSYRGGSLGDNNFGSTSAGQENLGNNSFNNGGFDDNLYGYK